MGSDATTFTITLLAFGPLGERLGGRSHTIHLTPPLTIRELVIQQGLEEWIDFGLSVALNGTRCSLDEALVDGCEIALLPPVSGG